MDKRFYTVILFLVASTVPIRGFNTYYLDESCGQEYQVEDSARLLASKSTNLQPGLNCTLYIKALINTIGGMPNVLARFMKFDIGTPTSCNQNRVELFDGIRQPTPITGPSGLCGSILSSYSYTTQNDSFMAINLITGSSAVTGGFDMMISSFHEEPCFDGEWKCTNNRCIDTKLRCNGYDNCGDNSDEEYERCQPQVFLDEKCGLSVNVFDSVKMKLSRDSNALIKNLDCTIDITARDAVIGGQPRVLAHFRSINLPSQTSGNCTQARIDLYDGIREPKQLTGPEGICGTNVRQDYATTSDNFMTLKFKTDGNVNTGDFNILLSMYHESPCFQGEWQCQNTRCILDYLKCDGNNNCGDNSDEIDTTCKSSKSDDDDLSGGAIAAIVLAVIAVVCMLAIVSAKFLYRKRSDYKQVA